MMKKLCFLFFGCAVLGAVFCSCAGLSGFGKKPTSGTYYVRADGNDRGNGLSEETPFRSLFKAMVMANSTGIKTIIVIGTLDVQSEQSSNTERVFILQGMGSDPILIRGKDSDTGPAVLSAEGSGRRVVLIKGTVPIHFENIEISGGETSSEGGGMGIGPGSSVTLGQGAVVRNNRAANIGGGVLVAPGGSLVVEGGKILDNSSAAVGGGIAAAGKDSTIVFRDGEISGNRAQGGGGVAVYQEARFTLSGGTIASNTADMAGGGVMVNQTASFTMEGGFIQDNSSAGSGGGIALMEKSTFILENGEIAGNTAGEHGGGIASDHTAGIILRGGFVSANSAAGRGGGVFTAGPFVKSAGKIYGNDMPEDAANVAPSGAAVFIFREDGLHKIREASAGEDRALDNDTNDGWDLAGGTPSEETPASAEDTATIQDAETVENANTVQDAETIQNTETVQDAETVEETDPVQNADTVQSTDAEAPQPE